MYPLSCLISHFKSHLKPPEVGSDKSCLCVNEETDSERWSSWPRVTQPVSAVVPETFQSGSGAIEHHRHVRSCQLGEELDPGGRRAPLKGCVWGVWSLPGRGWVGLAGLGCG